jgi:hypothetical protein
MGDCDQHRRSLISGAGPVDGDYRSASSTRSKLYGIAAPILLLASLKRFWETLTDYTSTDEELCNHRLIPQILLVTYW